MRSSDRVAVALVALLATAAPIAALASTQSAVVVERNGRHFIGSKEIEMKDGVPWVDGKALANYTIQRTAEQVARDRVDLPSVPGVDRLMLHVPARRLDASFVLPRLFVLDAKTGRAVAPEQLPAPLANVFADPQVASSVGSAKRRDPTTLAGALKYAVDDRSHVPDAVAWSNARFVIVQWWAGWCGPCLQEGKAISEAFAANPMPDVKWIAVEKDPTRSEKSYRAPATSNEAAL